MIRNECLKIVHKKIFLVSLLGFAVVTILLSALSFNGVTSEATVSQIVDSTIALLGMLVIVPWSIVAAPVIWTDEYQYGTLKQLFLHNASRAKLYAGKVAAMILLVFTAVGCMGVAAGLSGLLMAQPNMQQGDFLLVLYSCLSIVWQCCLYAALASMIGIWTRSAAVGVGGGLGFYFIQMIFGAA